VHTRRVKQLFVPVNFSGGNLVLISAKLRAHQGLTRSFVMQIIRIRFDFHMKRRERCLCTRQWIRRLSEAYMGGCALNYYEMTLYVSSAGL